MKIKDIRLIAASVLPEIANYGIIKIEGAWFTKNVHPRVGRDGPLAFEFRMHDGYGEYYVSTVDRSNVVVLSQDPNGLWSWRHQVKQTEKPRVYVIAHGSQNSFDRALHETFEALAWCVDDPEIALYEAVEDQLAKRLRRPSDLIPHFNDDLTLRAKP